MKSYFETDDLKNNFFTARWVVITHQIVSSTTLDLPIRSSSGVETPHFTQITLVISTPLNDLVMRFRHFRVVDVSYNCILNSIRQELYFTRKIDQEMFYYGAG